MKNNMKNTKKLNKIQPSKNTINENNIIKKINLIKIKNISSNEILTDNNNKKKFMRQSLRKILPIILELDEKVKTLINTGNQPLYYPNFRYYLSKGDKMKKYNNKKCIITSIFLNETYIPDILVFGQSFRNAKTKLPLICMVQDTPFDNFEGISKETIQDLLKIFDIVIGVDLLKINNFRKVRENNDFYGIKTYQNILYYVTKYQMLALTQFKQLYYFDASVYVGSNINIDSYLHKYKGNIFTYRHFRGISMGLNGSCVIIEPKLKYYYKLLYICNNFMKVFGDNIFLFNPDEYICYFCVLPEWDGRITDNSFFCQKIKYKNNIRKDCIIRRFTVIKPFRSIPEEVNISKVNIHIFDEWDEIVNKIIKKIIHFINIINIFKNSVKQKLKK